MHTVAYWKEYMSDDDDPSLPSPVKCGFPYLQNGKPYLQNGKVNVTGSTATFSCDSDYELNGVQSLSCQNGTWSGQVPTCEGNLLYWPIN